LIVQQNYFLHLAKFFF